MHIITTTTTTTTTPNTTTTTINIALSGTGLTNRKFQAGKQAKKLAEQMSIQREFQRQQQEVQLRQEETTTTTGSTTAGTSSGDGKGLVSNTEIMNNYNEKRKNLSLMDEHLAKRAKSNPNNTTTSSSTSNSNSIYQGRDANGQLIRRAFDREKDLLSSNRMDTDKIQKLVQNAKELDEKFDKAFVQKSFL